MKISLNSLRNNAEFDLVGLNNTIIKQKVNSADLVLLLNRNYKIILNNTRDNAICEVSIEINNAAMKKNLKDKEL